MKKWSEWQDMCKYPKAYESKSKPKFNFNLNNYIKSLCAILQREIDLLETKEMTDAEKDYFKGRISVLESVIDDLYRLRKTISDWRPKIGNACYEDELGRKRFRHPIVLMWLHEFDTKILGKEEASSG